MTYLPHSILGFFIRNFTIPSIQKPGAYKVKVHAQNNVTIGPDGVPGLSVEKRILVGARIQNVSVQVLRKDDAQIAVNDHENILLVKIDGKS